MYEACYKFNQIPRKGLTDVSFPESHANVSKELLASREPQFGHVSYILLFCDDNEDNVF
jgi:hypothetical protein